MGCKSLQLLVETAKHVDASSYEILCEATFGHIGWIICNMNMFLMSFGPMLSYMMIVKDTAGVVLGFETEAGQKMILVVCSVGIMLPLSLQRVSAYPLKDNKLLLTSDLFSIPHTTSIYLHRTWLTWLKHHEYVFSLTFSSLE